MSVAVATAGAGRTLPVALLLVAALGCAERDEVATAIALQPGEDRLLVLADETYVVGLLPRVGGRLVVFRRRTGGNVLLADPDAWTRPPPGPAADAEWQPYLGHITWLGPQAEWWTRTPLEPQRAATGATWPPDPWLIYGDYAVVESGPDHAVLRGPASPLSGIELTKRYRLGEGGLAITVTATNRSADAVRWDLWSVIRFDGATTRCYVPLPAQGANLRLEFQPGTPLAQGPIFYDVVDDHFSLRIGTGSTSGAPRSTAKYFMNPGAPYLAAFTATGDCFLTCIEPSADPPAPGHGRVEVYGKRDRDAGNGLLEVEHHGPYTTLQPGEAMTQHEVWSLHIYDGPDRPTAQAAFLRRVAEPGR